MFTIKSSKLNQVVKIFKNETDENATKEQIESNILADWHEGNEHQEWLNTASAQEIADWLASFHS